jgi:hypothetical protein
LKELSLRPRRDGETAFPDLATVLEAVRGVVRLRGDRRAIDAENKRFAHFKAHPELYVADDEIKDRLNKLAERMNWDKPREIDTTPNLVCCPKCSFEMPVAQNLYLWDSKKIYEYAAMKEELERIADRNRLEQKIPWTETEAVRE